jgi:hypothetical protein
MTKLTLDKPCRREINTFKEINWRISLLSRLIQIPQYLLKIDEFIIAQKTKFSIEPFPLLWVQK